MKKRTIKMWLADLERLRPADGRLTDAIKEEVGPLPIRRSDYSAMDPMIRVSKEAAEESNARGTASGMAQLNLEDANIKKDWSAAEYWRAVISWARE